MTQIRSDSRLGRGVRQARRTAGMTQAAVAESIGVSVRSIFQAERGQGHADIVLRIIESLGCEVIGPGQLPIADPGKILSLRRSEQGISARDAAGRAGISLNTAIAICRGELGHLATFERLAEALNVRFRVVRKGERRKFSSSTAFSSLNESWETPREFLAQLSQFVGTFDLDPCSPGALLSRVPALRHFTAVDDGLTQDWFGRVFMNPPYGRKIIEWVSKARKETAIRRAASVIGLVPARTDTRWWHSAVAGHADIWLLRGRLAFGDGAAPAPFPSAVLLWGGPFSTVSALSAAFPDAQHVPARDRFQVIE